MKKLIFLIFLWLIFLSCESSKPTDIGLPIEKQTEKLIHAILEGDLKVLEIEDCEYFVYKESQTPNHAYGYMAHKGNCKNPIHCYNVLPMDSSNVSNPIDSLTNQEE